LPTDLSELKWFLSNENLSVILINSN
jgi:hypothetical protein